MDLPRSSGDASSEATSAARPPIQEEAATDLSLPGQFVVSGHADPWREDWTVHQCGSVYVQADPLLPVRALVDETGQRVGLAAGWLIAPDGSMPGGDIQVPLVVSPNNVAQLERWIYGYGGRYIFFVLAEPVRRLYVDAGATLGVVFSEDRQMAGSTLTALVLHRPDHPLWSTSTRVFPDDRPNHYYPAGLTMDPTIRRLLPNHYLDLKSWEPVRHHPVGAPRTVNQSERRAAVEEIAGIVGRQIRAVVQRSPHTYMPLTAGRDSRTMLACSIDIRDHVEYVTFDYRKVGLTGTAAADLDLSREIARACGLDHRIVPVEATTPPGTDLDYLRRIGFSGGSGKSRDFYWSCREYLDVSAAWLTGFAGGAWRATFWLKEDEARSQLSGDELLARMGLPRTVELREAMDRWLSGVPAGLPLATVLELAYIEHRLGCWASPHLYGAAPFSMNLAPLCHREIFDIILGLPLAYKRRDLTRDIVSPRIPALDPIPYNNYAGLRGFRQRARRRVRRALGRRA
jgi:hypothetical protein